VRWDGISFLALCWLLGVVAWRSSKPFLPSLGGYRGTYCYQSNARYLLHILAPRARSTTFFIMKDILIKWKILRIHK
jgi:hypothetical protein